MKKPEKVVKKVAAKKSAKSAPKPKVEHVMPAVVVPPVVAFEPEEMEAPSSFVITQYAKQYGNDTWHFHPDCSNYPTGDFKVRTEKPMNGELCNECQSKAKGGAQ